MNDRTKTMIAAGVSAAFASSFTLWFSVAGDPIEAPSEPSTTTEVQCYEVMPHNDYITNEEAAVRDTYGTISEGDGYLKWYSSEGPIGYSETEDGQIMNEKECFDE